MRTPPDLVSATSQMWKVNLALFAMLSAILICCVAPYAPPSWPEDVAVTIQLISCLLAGVAMLYALRSVRCPSCGERWLTWSMRTQPFTQWMHVALSLQACPRCGHDASSADKLQSNPSLDRP